MRLAAGDVVVYAPHGIGRIAAKEKRVVLGAEQEIVVIELANGLTVTLPTVRAQEHLRPAASAADMRRVQETLGKDVALSGDPWLKRRQDTQAKLAGGDPIELAEIVRDGARRERMLGRGAKSRLSPSEMQLFVKARQLLSDEIAQAHGFDAAEADAWIDEQLMPTSAGLA